MHPIPPPGKAGTGVRHAAALVPALACLLLAATPVLGRDVNARQQTYLEYSRNLAAAWPKALARRIRQMEQRSSLELPPLEICRRAIDRVPGDIEDNPHRDIALVSTGPLGRRPDAWERGALAILATGETRAVHAFVREEPDGSGRAREVFRYIEPLERLPEPCDDLLQGVAVGPAVSIRRQAGTAEGGAREQAPVPAAPRLRLPHPQRQGPRR
jgi:hypothetical protein